MAQDPLIGRQIDGYRIEQLLGRGGMARVYRAVDEELGRYAAIKIIDPKIETDEQYRERFKNEARAIARLNHSHIVGIYRSGDVDGVYYMAMEYIDGPDLKQIISDYARYGQQMPHEALYKIVGQVGKALDYAHSQGVIHRDIKPSNIMLKSSGDAILTDFGLALVTTEGTLGTAFGSPQYIAPEQAISSGNVVPQSDLYALGVVIYEILTGTVPFNEGTPMQIAMAHLSEPIPNPRSLNPDLHPAFIPFLQKALEKEPQHRYPTGAKLTTALRNAITEARRGAGDTGTPQLLRGERVDLDQKIAEYRVRNQLPASPAAAEAATGSGLAGGGGVAVRRTTGAVAVVGESTTRWAEAAPANQSRASASDVEPVPVQPRRSRLVPVALLLLLIALVAGVGAVLVVSRPDDNPNASVAGGDGGTPSALYLEGVVYAINGTRLLVYDVPVELNRVAGVAPLLEALQPGSNLLLEGRYTTGPDGLLVVSAIDAASVDAARVLPLDTPVPTTEAGSSD